MVSTAPKQAQKSTDTEPTIRRQALVRFLGNSVRRTRRRGAPSSSPAASASSATATWRVSARRCCRTRSPPRRAPNPAALLPGPQRAGHGAQPRSPTPGRRTGCRPGRAAPVVGPGATNMLTGAALATINRLPVLLLPCRHLRHPGQHPVLQELELPSSGDVTVNDAFKPLSRATSTGCGAPSSCPPRCSARCGCSPTPSRPVRRRCPFPRTCKPRRYDWPESLFAERTWHVARPLPDAR